MLCDNLEEWDVGVGRWEGGSRGRGCVYTYSWFLLYNRNKHNIVQKFNSKKKKKKNNEDFCALPLVSYNSYIL